MTYKWLSLTLGVHVNIAKQWVLPFLFIHISICLFTYLGQGALTTYRMIMLMCHIKRECDHPYLKYNKEVVPRQMELLSCYKGLLSAVFKNVVINMFVWFSGCSSIIWITRGRKVRLSFMPPTSCRGSLWTTVKRWDTAYYLQNLPNSWPLIAKLLPVSIHRDSDLILCCWCCVPFQSHKVSVVKEDQLEGV